jgi:hypothetical protein
MRVPISAIPTGRPPAHEWPVPQPPARGAALVVQESSIPNCRKCARTFRVSGRDSPACSAAARTRSAGLSNCPDTGRAPGWGSRRIPNSAAPRRASVSVAQLEAHSLPAFQLRAARRRSDGEPTHARIASTNAEADHTNFLSPTRKAFVTGISAVKPPTTYRWPRPTRPRCGVTIAPSPSPFPPRRRVRCVGHARHRPGARRRPARSWPWP